MLRQKNKNKRGQLTIWIIVAILLVAIIFLLLFVYNPFKINFTRDEIPQKPEVFISDCISDEVLETVDLLSRKGGYLEDPNIFVPYNNFKVGYLCYTNQPYTICSNQQPFLDKFIEQELKTEFKQTNLINSCLSSYKTTVEKLGYQINTCNNPDFNVTIENDRIIFPFKCNIEMSKEDKSFRYQEIKPEVKTKLSNFIGIANKIVEQEIKNGDFDLLLGQMYLTDIELGRTRAGNTKLYILHESNTENYFIFGIKNLFQNSGL